MTIAEAVKEVLKAENKDLTCREITEKILEKELYQFHTNNPYSVVIEAIRRRCEGLDFPAAYPVKFFKIISGKKGKTTYQLLEWNPTDKFESVQSIKKIKNASRNRLYNPRA